jgi:hypothetical protein
VIRRVGAGVLGLGRTGPAQIVDSAFGLVGRHFPHILSAANQIALPALKNGNDVSAFVAFVDLTFFCHGTPPVFWFTAKSDAPKPKKASRLLKTKSVKAQEKCEFSLILPHGEIITIGPILI